MSSSASNVRGTIFSCVGKRVFITGASSGFGEHFALTFARAGASVIALAARRVKRLESLAKRIRALDGVEPNITVVCVACDVSNTDSIVKAFDDAQTMGQVDCFDVIVNNAGIGTDGKFLNVSERDYDQLMAVNVKGCWFVAQEAARRMASCSRTGSIVNIASIYGLRVGVVHSAYAATKAAVVHMTKAMAIELLKHGIRVNCVCPGYFWTEMTTEFFSSPAGKRFAERKIPMKRLGTVGELDGVMLLLASNASSFMTGSIVAVDGGHLVASL